MDRLKTAALTGHRKLNADPQLLSRRIEEAVEDLCGHGYEYFLSDMAEGFGLLAAEAIVRTQAAFPQIRLVAVLPFPYHTKYFTDADKLRYGWVRSRACDEVLVSRHYFPGCFHRCSDYLIGNASQLVAWYGDLPCGGTYYAVSNAIKRGIPVRNLAQRERLKFRMTGNGLAIDDRNSVCEGGYKTVAHIAFDREVTFFDPFLSLTARAQIERFARMDNMFPASQPHSPALTPISA